MRVVLRSIMLLDGGFAQVSSLQGEDIFMVLTNIQDVMRKRAEIARSAPEPAPAKLLKWKMGYTAENMTKQFTVEEKEDQVMGVMEVEMEGLSTGTLEGKKDKVD